jgi:hypothetical protein
MNGMIDFNLAGCLADPPIILQVKNRPEIWAKLRLTLRLPHYEKDGQLVPGPVRYFTVVAFAPLSNRIQDQSLVTGDWVIVRVRDLRSSVWLDARTNRPKSTVELIAESITFPTREQVAALLAATRGPAPVLTSTS